MRIKDITGHRFGALVAIRPVPSSETADHNPGWLVHCDCGNERIVNGKRLRQGLITSCGCHLNRNKMNSKNRLAAQRYTDYTGQTFGELTAIEYIGKGIWRWRCSCGKETCVKASHVISGDTLSCGHLQREMSRRRIEDNVFGHYEGTAVPVLKRIVGGRKLSTNSTGITGVSVRVHKACTMYRAQICVRGKTIYLGDYRTLQEAAEARKRAEEKYFVPIIEAYEKEKNKTNTD